MSSAGGFSGSRGLSSESSSSGSSPSSSSSTFSSSSSGSSSSEDSSESQRLRKLEEGKRSSNPIYPAKFHRTRRKEDAFKVSVEGDPLGELRRESGLNPVIPLENVVGISNDSLVVLGRKRWRKVKDIPLKPIRHRWKVGNVLGSGNFGQTRTATDLLTGKLVAVKLESSKNKKAGHLEREYKMYRTLQGGVGIPEVLFFGRCTTNYNAIVFQLLHRSLRRLMDDCGGQLSVPCVSLIAVQLMERFEFVHSKGIVHRDVKPDNFLMGLDVNERTVYIIDFGLARFYVDPVTHVHVPYQVTKSVTGTVRYMSMNAHRGVQQSRRDDLESLGYMFLFLLNGRLPWMGVKGSTAKVRYEKILEMKMTMPLEELCKGVPEEFSDYLDHTRKLGFYDAPNYFELRRLFVTLLGKTGYPDISKALFDWEKSDETLSERSVVGGSQSASKFGTNTFTGEGEESVHRVAGDLRTITTNPRAPYQAGREIGSLGSRRLTQNSVCGTCKDLSTTSSVSCWPWWWC